MGETSVHAALLVTLACAVGCAASATPRPAGSAVEFSEALPFGFESLGAAHAECRGLQRAGTISGEPATTFACRRTELERSLVEQANALGGTLLSHERCHPSNGGLACSALVARPSVADSPAGATVARAASSTARFVAANDDGLPVTVASRILIDVERGAGRVDRRARTPDQVTDFVAMPVGHTEVGTVRARCEPAACDDGQARAALRLAAGGLGVSGLVGTACFVIDGERACVGTLAATERDPETDPAAR
jgi:hypothetical protein